MYNRDIIMLKDKHFWLLSIILLGLTIGLILVFLFATPVNTPVEGAILAEKLEPFKYNLQESSEEIKIVENSIKFFFVGDIMLDRNVDKVIDKEGFDYLFSTLPESFFNDFDLVGANLESAITKDGKHYLPNNVYDFAISEEKLQKLYQKGFNFFTIANNHIADQGQIGINETQEFLDKNNINYVGCNDKQVGDCSVKIIEIKDKKIGVAGFSMIYGKFDESKALELINELASSTDLAIVNIHWGVEYNNYFNKTQQNLAYRIIDAGADIIIGHHPHVVQGVEIYKNKPIFYSLGNFIFDQYFSEETQEGLGVKIDFSKEELNFNLIPFVSKNSKPSFKISSDKVKFLESFVLWSKITDDFKSKLLAGEFTLKKIQE